MKTSLAIATAALMLSAMLSLTSSVAAHDYGNLSGRAMGHTTPSRLPSPRAHPRPLSQSLGCEMYQPASPWGGWLVLTRSNGSAKCGSPRQLG
jgi:hypothetical protein